MRAPLVVAALALVPSCSLLGLDRLEQATCMPGPSGDAFCASLDTVQPTGDACLRWQCGDVTNHCEVEIADADGDGAPAPTCGSPTMPDDCDDDDGSNAPGGTEICDGTDDDCDGRIDEGAVGDAALAALRALPTGAGDPVFARAPDADETAIAVLVESTGQVHVVLDVPTPELVVAPVRTEAGGAVPASRLTSIVGLGMDRWALFFEVDEAACPRSVIGILDTTTMRITVDDTLAPGGFPRSDGDCTAGATSTGALGLDAVTDDLLVTYLEGRARDCSGAGPASVLAIGAPDGAPAAAGIDPIVLGESVDSSPPAVLPLGSRQFLVAFATAASEIEVHRVTLMADGSATETLVHTEAVSSLGAEVGLAVGTTTAGTTEVALTHAACGGAAPASLRFLSVSAAGATPGAAVGGMAISARHPVAVRQPTANEWLLAWHTARTASGRRIAADGTAIGDDFALTDATEGFAAALILSAPGRGTGAAYRFATTRAEAGTTSAVAADLGCLPMTASP